MWLHTPKGGIPLLILFWINFESNLPSPLPKFPTHVFFSVPARQVEGWRSPRVRVWSGRRIWLARSGHGDGGDAITTGDTNYNVIYLPPSQGCRSRGGWGWWLALERKSIATAKRARTKPRIQPGTKQGQCIRYSGVDSASQEEAGMEMEAAIKLANECQLLLPLMALMSSSMSSSLSVPKATQTPKSIPKQKGRHRNGECWTMFHTKYLVGGKFRGF